MDVREEARTHLAAGRPARAVQLLTAHLAQRADDQDAWDDAAEALLGLGQPDAAVEAAKEAFRRGGGLESAALLAVALARAGRTIDALTHVEHVLSRLPRTSRGWERIARAFEALGRLDAGIDARRQAARLDPDDPSVRLRLAERLERADARGEARALVEQVLDLDPDHPSAQRILVRLDHNDGRLDDAAERARSLLAVDPDDSSLWMELARIEARRGRPAEAMAAAGRGNTSALRAWTQSGGDLDRLPATLDRLRASAVGPLPTEREEGGAAAFVVGFPRSGTTLVQQLLEAHPAIRTLDELPLVDGAVGDVLPGADLVTATLRSRDPAVGRAIRAAWWRRVHARIPAHEGLVVDKLPLNLLRVELLARAFPGAPIVAVIRDPRDAVLSAYLQDFELNVAMAQCADLQRCAALYERAFDRWFAVRDHLPQAIEVRYEDVVADREAALRPVLSLLGLPWDDAVLDHTAAARAHAIGTPSYADVRQPVYDRSVGRWRTFADALAPVLDQLAPYVEGFGYPPS
ncbi:MAG: sulfotransferase [Myxococcota bacterium]